MKLIKSTKFITLLLTGIIGISTLGLAPVAMADGGDCSDICSEECDVAQEVKDAAGCNNTGDKLPSAVINIINGVIATAGLVAVIFIIIGGYQYMTSTGDPGKVKKAKDTILYACIGLVICVLAFAIVNFVVKDIIGK